MKLPGADQPVRDLTRWNRAGLDRFRYVDGGAAEWLEYLRVCHLLLYADPARTAGQADPDVWMEAYANGRMPDGRPVREAAAALLSKWPRLGPDGFVPDNASRAEILRAQYDWAPLDQTAGISRAFARAFHILTESLDAFANEGFLATATQDAHLRRLLAMIGYRPAPAASATAPVAMILADGQARQTIPAGVGFEHNPGGGAPVIAFESLDAIPADRALNLLRPEGWNQRSDPVPATQREFAIVNAAALNADPGGSYALLMSGVAAEAVRVRAVDKAAATVVVDRGATPVSVSFQSAVLAVGPKINLPARPRGPNWIAFRSEPKSWVGQTVALEAADQTRRRGFPGSRRRWDTPSAKGVAVTTHAQVLEVRGRDIRLDRAAPDGLLAVYPTVQAAVIEEAGGGPGGADILKFGPFIVPEGVTPIGETDDLDSRWIYVAGNRPPRLVLGAQIAVVRRDGRSYGGLVSAFEVVEGGFRLQVAAYSGAAAEIASIHADFAAASALVHDTRSDAPLFDAQGRLGLVADPAVRELVRPGRRVIVATDPELAGAAAPVAAGLTVDTVSPPDAAGFWIAVREPVAALSALTRGDAVVYANVALFGHGKASPAAVLGSGDPAVPAQAMPLHASPVSTRPDNRFPGGVALDIAIAVDGREWRQVAGADEAVDDQPTYAVILDDDGKPSVVFHRRLPAGKDNVVVTRLRKGAGVEGNRVPPYSARAPKPPFAPVAALVQPVSPRGGADAEGAAALRDRGRSQFALMGRALTVEDFATLAESHSGVWRARAALRRIAGAGGRQTVALTVVPNGGGDAGAIASELRAFLAERAPPGIDILIESFVPAQVGGAAVVTLRSGFARSQTIVDEIGRQLMARFGLARRGLGETLFVAELVAAIEAHPAVDHLSFTLVPRWTGPAPRLVRSESGAIQSVVPGRAQVVYIEDAGHVALSWAGGSTP